MDFIAAIAEPEISRRMRLRASFEPAFFAISALLFVASAVVTIVWCGPMSAMGEMPMPGDWTMSMAWMLMPGPDVARSAAASFLGMWIVMMVAMMLPSLVPMLWRYRRAVGTEGPTRAWAC